MSYRIDYSLEAQKVIKKWKKSHPQLLEKSKTSDEPHWRLGLSPCFRNMQ